jgi:hypothetical protein
MSIDPKKALADIDSVLKHGARGRQGGDADGLGAMMKACILRWAPRGSPYWGMATGIDPFTSALNLLEDPIPKLRGVLVALRRDYHQGQVMTFEEMVHASMFDGLLGQAQSLLEGDYRLAAAVIAGATLESHLRDLAGKLGLGTVDKKKNKTIPRTASALNDDLHAKANAYSTTEFRQVQVWIDLRNEAAHGKPEFQRRTEQDVTAMITGIREFMVRNPA